MEAADSSETLVQYNLANPIYIGPRYCRITENDGLLEKVGTPLLSFVLHNIEVSELINI
jgi:hypothetical protein